MKVSTNLSGCIPLLISFFSVNFNPINGPVYTWHKHASWVIQLLVDSSDGSDHIQRWCGVHIATFF